MANLVEMDEKVTLKDQMEDEVSGPVILISKFNVEPNDVDYFLKIWEENATNFKRQPDLFRHNYIKALEKVAF